MSDWSMDGLAYLNTSQALADIAYFVAMNNPRAVPVVVVGGGYAGGLAAWFRARYSHLTVAAWTSSPTLDLQADFTGLDEYLFDSVITFGNDDCYGMFNAVTTVNHNGGYRDDGNEDNFITRSLVGSSVPNISTNDWFNYYFDIIS